MLKYEDDEIVQRSTRYCRAEGKPPEPVELPDWSGDPEELKRWELWELHAWKYQDVSNEHWQDLQTEINKRRNAKRVGKRRPNPNRSNSRQRVVSIGVRLLPEEHRIISEWVEREGYTSIGSAMRNAALRVAMEY